MTQATPGTNEPATQTPPANTPAVERTTAPPAPNEKTFTQDQVNELIRERLARVKGGEEADARFAELENTVKATKELLEAEQQRAQAAEQKALKAAVIAQAADFANPERALQLISLDGVTSDDSDKIKTALDALRASDPYLLKPAGEQQQEKQRQTPGADKSGTTGTLSPEQLSTLKPEDLAKDPDKLKLYIESLDARQK